mgnify:CR=1 FL=1
MAVQNKKYNLQFNYQILEKKDSDLYDFYAQKIFNWYQEKHDYPMFEEVEFLNSFERTHCPRCYSPKIIKNGYTPNLLKKYRCKDCNFSFNQLTNTFLDSKKISLGDWIQFLLGLFSFNSTKSTSFLNRNATKTGIYWLEKVFIVLKQYQENIILNKKVWIDETFVSVNKKHQKLKNGKLYRGISRNKICICTGTNKKQTFLIVSKKSKLDEKTCFEIYKDHIEKGSCLIHDSEKSHNILVKELDLKEKKYLAKEIKALNGEKNPLHQINKIHSLLKYFLTVHRGINKDNLQNWLNLFSFIINKPFDQNLKVILFIKMAFSCNFTLRYRDKFN